MIHWVVLQHMIRFRYLPFTWGKPKFQVSCVQYLNFPILLCLSPLCTSKHTFTFSFTGEWGGWRRQGAPFATECLINWPARRGAAVPLIILWFISWAAAAFCRSAVISFCQQVSDQCCPSQAREEGKWPRTKWWGLPLWSTYTTPLFTYSPFWTRPTHQPSAVVDSNSLWEEQL